jgi:cell division protein FtsA
VFWKNVMRHLAVIPIGVNNITKDIASLGMEESEAEKMKLKYGSAYTDVNDIDDTLKYSIDPERSVESRKFIDIVEGRLTEIILNVREQIPNEYYDKLLGGIILTGGGANMRNIEQAFTTYTHIEKVRVAKFVTLSINSSHEAIKSHNAMMNTALGLLAKGDFNCAGAEIDASRDLFGQNEAPAAKTPEDQRQPRQPHETAPGVIRTEEEERLAAEKAQREKEEKERLDRLAAEAQKKKEEEERKKNSLLNRIRRGLSKLGEDIVRDE